MELRLGVKTWILRDDKLLKGKIGHTDLLWASHRREW